MTVRQSTRESWCKVACGAGEVIRDRCSEHLLVTDAADALNVSRRKLQRALEAQGTDFTRELFIACMERAES
jgi:predicted DNA-binding protein (UPF0251 family)